MMQRLEKTSEGMRGEISGPPARVSVNSGARGGRLPTNRRQRCPAKQEVTSEEDPCGQRSADRSGPARRGVREQHVEYERFQLGIGQAQRRQLVRIDRG